MGQLRRYPLNAAGDFYVAGGLCIFCKAPEQEAPDLVSHDPFGNHCFFRRQPETPGELGRAVTAVAVGCCGAVRYGGADPDVLRSLAEHGAADACDHRL